jgi:hypothetical protein
MKVKELLDLLEHQPNATISFDLPSGGKIPAHFHVTEVGKVEKSFIDCGGTFRSSKSCVLQIWTADDFEHRLSGSKLRQIMGLASPLMDLDDLPVEVEYGPDVASTYSIGDAISAFGTVHFKLLGKKTDCLAKERCGVPDSSTTESCC